MRIYAFAGDASQSLTGLIFPQIAFFIFPRKNDPHIRVLLGFMGSGWGKIRGKKQLDLKGL